MILDKSSSEMGLTSALWHKDEEACTFCVFEGVLLLEADVDAKLPALEVGRTVEWPDGHAMVPQTRPQPQLGDAGVGVDMGDEILDKLMSAVVGEVAGQ